MVDFNGKVLTNVNFKNLTEQLGFRGRQEHYDAYVEDFVIRQQEDGSEVVEFREGPTKTRSGGLTILRRTTPQAMYSTDGGKTDPVRLLKLWLSKRPDGMKDKGPLYLSVINRPKSNDIWYTKIRMGVFAKLNKKNDSRKKKFFLALVTVLPKSFTAAFSSNSRLDVRENL